MCLRDRDILKYLRECDDSTEMEGPAQTTVLPTVQVVFVYIINLHLTEIPQCTSFYKLLKKRVCVCVRLCVRGI